MTRISETGSNTELYNQTLSAGCVGGAPPVVTDVGGGSITASECKCLLFSNNNKQGALTQYTIPALASTAITIDAVSYLVVNYNAGNPVYQILEYAQLSQINESDIVPISTLYNEGNTLIHTIHWDELGQGLSNKLHMRQVKTERFALESGLVLTAPATQRVAVSSGRVWVGAVYHDLLAFSSATVGNRFYFWRKTGASTWTRTVTTDGTGVFNNTQFNTTAGVLSTIANNNSYAVNWIYRDLGNNAHAGYVLGTTEYTTLAAAQASSPRSDLPPEFGVHSVLVGRIIVQKNSTTAAVVDSAFTTKFVGSPTSTHNDLAGLQGGLPTTYYHSNQAINTTNTPSFAGLVLPKTTGVGIKIDQTTPTFGWRDLEGVEYSDLGGATGATLSVYRAPLREYAFNTGDRMDIRFHVPHDYVPNTDMYLHVHWSHNGTAVSGAFTATMNYSYSKGHNQANFSAPKVVSVTYPTVNIATTPQYRHRIEEVVFTTPTPGGTATLLDNALLEVDGLILVGLTVTAKPTITGGVGDPFIHRVDIHYQSTNLPTKQRNPPFWT